MTDTGANHNFRDNIAIAIDGGGIKGAVVAQGITKLEQKLGVKRLIDCDKIKVIVGTSTGSVLAAGLAIGMTGQELLALYESLGERIFSKPGELRPFGWYIPLLNKFRLPGRILNAIADLKWIGISRLAEILIYILYPARYSFDPLRKAIQEQLKAHAQNLPNTDPTIGQLGTHLRNKPHGPTIIFTATEPLERQTHFLKTNDQETFKQMKLVDTILASSSIPTFWPPIQLEDGKPGKRWLVDGGVGSFGNPAFVAAWEMCDKGNPDENRQHKIDETTIISLGTGTVSADTYRKEHGEPPKWWALNWARRGVDVFSDSAVREQSRTIAFSYKGIDLRRFQVEYDEVIEANRFDLVGTGNELDKKGKELQSLIDDNKHALHFDPAKRVDPEGIWDNSLANYVPKIP